MTLLKVTLTLCAVFLGIVKGSPIGGCGSESNSFSNNLLNNGNLGSSLLNLQNVNGINNSPLAFSGNVNNFSPLSNIANEVSIGNLAGNCGCSGNGISPLAFSGNFLQANGVSTNLSPLLANAGLSGSLTGVPGTPLITEVVPNLKFGEVSVTGDLPVGGSIKVCGCFPVYGVIAVDGSVPTSGTAVIDTGNNVVTQVF